MSTNTTLTCRAVVATCEGRSVLSAHILKPYGFIEYFTPVYGFTAFYNYILDDTLEITQLFGTYSKRGYFTLYKGQRVRPRPRVHPRRARSPPRVRYVAGTVAQVALHAYSVPPRLHGFTLRITPHGA